MNYDLRALSERLAHVECEVASIRRELLELDQTKADQQAGMQTAPIQFQTEKALHRRLMKNLLAELAIQCQPISSEELQARIEQVGLATNELSRDLIKAREG